MLDFGSPVKDWKEREFGKDEFTTTTDDGRLATVRNICFSPSGKPAWPWSLHVLATLVLLYSLDAHVHAWVGPGQRAASSMLTS